MDDLGAFSYSTLVYRSLVLTKASELGLLDFTKSWNDEYSMVENALFTEPADQALWFYLRWLLLIDFGACLSLDQQSNEIVPLRVVLVKASRLLIFRLNKVVKQFPFDEVRLGATGRVADLKSTIKSVQHRPSKLWFIPLTAEGDFDEIQLNGQSDSLHLKLRDLNNYRLWINEQDEQAGSQMKIQSQQLESLLSLKELEPKNKWLNLILSYFENTDRLQILDDLCKLDPLRTNYYKDQKSRIKLEKWIGGLAEDEMQADLSSLQLTVLYTPEPFAHLSKLILTGNKLSCLTSNLNCLVSLKTLVLDDNLIYKIQKKFTLASLEVLSIQNNSKSLQLFNLIQILSFMIEVLANSLNNRFFSLQTELSKHSGIGHLTSCPNLKQIYLFGNKLSEEDLNELLSKQINCHLERI